jgi:hypothetical protein
MQPRKMQGTSLIRFLFLAAILSAVIVPAAKLIPAYIESYNVRQSMQAVANDESLTRGMDVSEAVIRTALQKRFDINGVQSVNANKLRIKVVRDGYQLNLNYQIIVTILANFDVVLTFDEEVVVNRSAV